jgi:hypothetical protein
VLFVATSILPVGFQCGVLQPGPGFRMFPFTSSPNGSIELGWTSWPAGLSGASVFLQFAIKDAGAGCGTALSNTLWAEVP